MPEPLHDTTPESEQSEHEHEHGEHSHDHDHEGDGVLETTRECKNGFARCLGCQRRETEGE